MTISAVVTPPALQLPPTDPPGLRWFSARGCVMAKEGRSDVFVGGTLVSSFGPRDRGMRNAVLVGLAADPQIHLGRLARAFGISSEALRQLRAAYESGGAEAIFFRAPGRPSGSRPVTPEVRNRLERLFEEGLTAAEAHRKACRRVVTERTVARLRASWFARTQSVAQGHVPSLTGKPAQLALVPQPQDALPADGPAASAVELADNMPTVAEAPAADARTDSDVRIAGAEPKNTGSVQHLGTWLLVAMVHSLGLHERAARAAAGRVNKSALRLCLDAVVIALAIGERCVEGVRRLATSTAAALMLASSAPSPTWTRRVLGRFAQDGGGAMFHLGMAHQHLGIARAEASREGPVFYADNHLRLYTGKHVVRRGWRMQDKRVRPGATDYYVHDEDGRPVGRITAPHHGSLTDFLSPIAALLRLALPEEDILVAFDRAGAFPVQMATLRNAGVEFVTYERRPYALLAESEFTEEVVIDGERLRLCESRKNLGQGRGRVRRVCVRTEEGRQVNLLAVSRRPARRLVEVMRGRWNQENGFKYGNERWGLNQLDGRTVVDYSPDTIIPNPARRRLDNALRIARVREGLARAGLARFAEGDSRREVLERDVTEAVCEQRRLEELRPSMPTHAPLKETELAGKLVHHEIEYKLVVDTIRIACANAESELATLLAPALPRAAEAKKVLANVFTAPGRLQVGRRAITITLQPAGNKAELAAITDLFRTLNQRHLALPGDQAGRRLRFRVHQVS